MSRILIADDHPGVQKLVTHVMKQRGHDTVTVGNGDDAVDHASAEEFDLIISDIRMPGAGWPEILSASRQKSPHVQLVLITGYASVSSAVEALKSQAAGYVSKPFKVDDLTSTVELALEQAQEKRSQSDRLRRVQQELKDKFRFENIVGTSAPMLEVYKIMHKVLNISSSVLIEGESGTGKELVARAIHYNGSRREAPFIAIDCGSLPETLLESELFGYRKGAFTGATEDKQGLFQAAHGGTVFLDEISGTSPALQAKLLRVIQTGEIRRIGSSQPMKIDVRLVAATNQPLDKLVEEKQFREDLFFRLKVITIALPPLRERIDDIPLLTKRFLEKYAGQLDRQIEGITEKALAELSAYPWPGNVRELEHVIERAVALSSGNEITVEDLPQHIRGVATRSSPHGITLPSDGLDLNHLLKEIEADLLREAMARTGGVKERAARLLGLNRTTLVEKLKRIAKLTSV